MYLNSILCYIILFYGILYNLHFILYSQFYMNLLFYLINLINTIVTTV